MEAAGSGFGGLQPTWGLERGVHVPLLQPHSSHQGSPGAQRGAFSTSISGKFCPRKGRGPRSCWMRPEPQRLRDPGCPLSLAPNQSLEEGLSRGVCLLAPPSCPRGHWAQACLGFPVFSPKDSGVNSFGMRATLPWA